MGFVAFPATEYDEVLSGYQPGQMIERWANQRFEDHLCPRPQGTSLTMVGKNILTKYMYTWLGLFKGPVDGQFRWIEDVCE
jgi:hypothetical protein